MSQAPSNPPAAADTWTKPPKKRRWRRRLLWAFGVLVLLIVALVALAPTIAGYLAPGIAEKQINALIAGAAKVQGASFSWFGSQSVGPVTISTPDGKAAATVTINLSHSLSSLAKAGLGMGSMDLGSVTISGSAQIVRHADGSMNLLQAIAPRSPSSSSPAPPSKPGEIKLPPTLAASIVIERLDVKYTDESAPKGSPAAYVELPGVSGKVEIGPGAKGSSGLSASVGLMAAVRYGATPDAATTQGGSLNVGITAASLTDPSGRLTPDTVSIDATIDASDLDMNAADALAGMKGQLAAALGNKLKVAVKANGTLKDGHATIAATSPLSRTDLAFRAWDGAITSERPGVIDLDTAGALKFAPALVDAAKSGSLALDTYPHLTLTIDQVKVPGTALTAGDLRAVGARLVIDTTAIGGNVSTPAPPAPAGAPAAPVQQPFRVEPLHAEFAAADLAKGATLKASTTATLGKEVAGKLLVDLTLGGVLDASGHASPSLPSLQGKAEITDVSTAIAQPIAEASGIDLAKGVGPKLDITLAAATAGPPEAATGLPPTNIDVHIKSNEVVSDALLVADAKGIRSRKTGPTLVLKKPIALAGKNLVGKGVDISGDGFFKVAVTTLNIPWNAQHQIDAANLAATVATEFGGVTVRPTPAAGAAPAEPVSLKQFFANITLKPGAQPRFDLKGSGTHQGADFFTQAGFDFPGASDVIAAAASGGDAASKAQLVRPVGSYELRKLPISLGTMTLAAPAGAPDLRKLIQDAVGPDISIKLDLAQRAGATPEARDITFALISKGVNGTLAAGLDATKFSIGDNQFTTTASPDLVASLIDAFGSKLASKPTLAAPAAVKLSIAPFTVPLTGFAPQLAGAGDASVKVEFSPAEVRNITFAAADGKPGGGRDIGPVGVRDTVITATVPLSAMGPGAPPKPARANIAATLTGDNAQPIATLKTSALVTLAAGAPSGPIHTELNVELLNTPKLDAILDQPGMVSGAVGDKLSLTAAADAELNDSAAGGGLKSLAATASITSPRIKTTQPFSLGTKNGVASIDKPAVLAGTIDPAWANRFLPKPPPQQPNAKPLMALSEQTDFTLSLYKLAISLDPAGGPLKPGVFAADVEFSLPAASLALSGVPDKIKNLHVRASSGNEPGVLGFSLRADDLGGGPAPGGKPAVDLAGGLYGIADAQGNPTFGDAKLTAKGMAYNVPSPIIDAAAQQNGLLVDAIGPAVTVNLDAKGFSMAGGQFAADASSDRTSSKVTAAIQKGGTADVTLDAKLTRVTPELGAHFTKGLPMLGSFEKQKTDAPATVNTAKLTLPLDGNLAKLNGVIKIDPGEARFTTSSVFGKLLKLTHQRDAGVVGRKLEPLELTLTNGVATYPRYRIPLGEFTVESQGTVDLVSKQLDVVTYVPFGSLTDEAAGIFNSGLGKLLGGALPTIEKATMVPIRTKGPLDNPSTKPDVDLFFKEAGKTLLRPDKVVGGALGDILNKVNPKSPKK